MRSCGGEERAAGAAVGGLACGWRGLNRGSSTHTVGRIDGAASPRASPGSRAVAARESARLKSLFFIVCCLHSAAGLAAPEEDAPAACRPAGPPRARTSAEAVTEAVFARAAASSDAAAGTASGAGASPTGPVVSGNAAPAAVGGRGGAGAPAAAVPASALSAVTAVALAFVGTLAVRPVLARYSTIIAGVRSTTPVSTAAVASSAYRSTYATLPSADCRCDPASESSSTKSPMVTPACDMVT
mmetsp:Transcript_8100/g.26061  ORF Transcript_8100/g.26061 Transcript_8100/m.26061 type:complete len:243 (-) Transcript_8100:57-785(-)